MGTVRGEVEENDLPQAQDYQRLAGNRGGARNFPTEGLCPPKFLLLNVLN